MQLRAIIFDYGGVLCVPPPDQQVRALAVQCRLELDQFLKGYWELRATYDRGDIEPRDYWREIGRPWSQFYTDDDIELFRRADVLFWVRLDQRMLGWARRVRAAGIRTGLLSNLPIDLARHLRDGMALTADFDHHTFSSELRVAKPEAAIYRQAVAGLKVEPGEAVFIDDRQDNVDGAAAFGLHAIRFESLALLQKQLDELALAAGGFVSVSAPPVILE